MTKPEYVAIRGWACPNCDHPGYVSAGRYGATIQVAIGTTVTCPCGYTHTFTEADGVDEQESTP